MPTPCYISITGQTQGNITAGAFHGLLGVHDAV